MIYRFGLLRSFNFARFIVLIAGIGASGTAPYVQSHMMLATVRSNGELPGT